MVARVMKNASCKQAALGGHLDCVRLLFDKVKPSRDMEEEVAGQATGAGHTEILKYIVEERKISDVVKSACVYKLQRLKATSIAFNT